MRTIVLPDIHYPKHDPAALRWALRYVDMLQPRRVILLGDVINLDAVSRFPMPSRVVTNFPTEIRKYRAFYQRLVRRLPRDVVYVLGNHEQRLQSYLVKRAPALAELPDLQLKEFLRLPKSWKIIPYPTGIWEEQGVICMHGQKYSQSCVQRYIKFGCSTVSGHSHRVTVYVRRQPSGRQIVNAEIGCLCKILQGYNSPLSDWCHAIAIIEGGDVRVITRQGATLE